MLGLPEATEIRKTIHKKIIYSKFDKELSGERKKSFDEDISRVTIMNEISPVSLNISEGNEKKAIFVIAVNIKKPDYDERNISLITKLFGQNVVVVLEYDEKEKVVIHQTKLLTTDWVEKNSYALKLTGLDLDKVWDNIVIQISGVELKHGNTLKDQLAIEEEKKKLIKQIVTLEKMLQSERQPKKKYELFQRLKEYKTRLKDLG